MKFTLLCIILLAATPAVFGLSGSYKDFKTFWSALGAQYKIDTSSVDKCYSALSAPIYWHWVSAEVNVQVNLIQSQEVKFLAAAAVLKGVASVLSSELNCMLNSQGYANLNKSMTYD